jgi:cytochrome c-type biogenesis protein CcmF
LVAALGIGLVAWRADRLHAPGRIDSAVSRESAFLANNLLFAGLAFVVLLGTVFPLLAEAVRGSQVSVGEPYFDRMTVPLGVALLFLMAVAPALPWRAASGEVLRHRLLLPAWFGVAALVAAIALGVRDLMPALAFGLAGFTFAAIVRETFVAVRARRGAEHTGWARSLVGTFAGNPRRYGGLVVHLGVVLIAVALAAGGSFGTKREVRLRRGESASVGGYTVTFLRTTSRATEQKTTVSAQLRVHRGSRDLGVYAPSVSSFPNSQMAIGTPSVRTGLLDDVYLTLVSSPNDQGRVTVGVAINAMTLWVWVGGALMATGTAIALWPAVRRRVVRARDALPEAALPGGTPPPGGNGGAPAVEEVPV